MTLEEAREKIGYIVEYTPYENCPQEEKEYGIITNVTEHYVFVKYGKDLISKATRAEDLKI